MSASPCHLVFVFDNVVASLFFLLSIGLLMTSSLPTGTLRNVERLISLDMELHREKITTPFVR